MTLRGSHDSVSGYEVNKTTNRQKDMAKMAAENLKAPECSLLCRVKNIKKALQNNKTVKNKIMLVAMKAVK
jgi:hypothetical protein